MANIKEITSAQQQKLKIYTLGTFSVNHGEEEITEKTKGSSKLWELFKYLLTHRGRLLSPEQVLDTLWPDLEYAEPKAAFRYQVHRIKKTLAQDATTLDALRIVSSGGLYSLELKEDCWVDALEFEELSRKATACSDQDPESAIELHYQALSIYKGDYLPGAEIVWVLPVRNYYRHLYLRNTLELTELLKSSQRYSEIIELCRKSFLLEPFEEKLHLRYLEALMEEGKMGQARTHYEYITSLMYQELGIKPSPEMQKCYQVIKSNISTPGTVNIQELLKRDEKGRGALLCEPEVFRFLFNREMYRAEREDASLHFCLMTLTAPDFSFPPPELLSSARRALQHILLSRLRKSDVICRWNEAQFALLLPGLNYEQAQMVLQRVRKEFLNNFSEKAIILRCNAHSLFPWE